MDGNFRMVLITVTVSAALLFFNSILLYFRKNFQAHLIAKMNQAFRSDISNRILKEPFEKLTATDAGEYLSWYTNDVREAENQGFQVFYSCMDEITANLDADTEKVVMTALKRVAEKRTVISISHRTSAELGRVIEVGTCVR